MTRTEFRSVFVVVFCMVGAMFLVAEPAFARATRHVKPVASGSGNGSSWANASGDLGAMLNASAAGDEVWVAAGTYDPGSNRAATFTIKGGVALHLPRRRRGV